MAASFNQQAPTRGIGMQTVKRLFVAVDPFVASLLAIVVVATLVPCSGTGAVVFDYATDVGIVLLFFCMGRSCRGRQSWAAC